MSTAITLEKSRMQRVLDVVERVGNRVPHPAVIFLLLILATMLLAHVFYISGAAVRFERINPDTHQMEEATAEARSLLTGEGLRFIYTSMIPNFMGFTAVGLLIAAMIGVGVAEHSGLVQTLIRKLAAVAPPKALTYILVFVGILSSVAADAGYLVLIPLAGIAFLTVGRHPEAGIAAGFAAVAGAFTVNLMIKPLDAVLTELTNDAIRAVNPTLTIDLTANLWFSLASVVLLTLVISLVTERIIEPRLGEYHAQGDAGAEASRAISPQESRGLLFAGIALLVTLAASALLTLPTGAPLRDPDSGGLIGDTPFMNHLIVFILVLFLAAGAAYGFGAGTMKNATDVITAIEKSIGGLGSLILLLFIIAQFVAYFNYTNMATIIAVALADWLEGSPIGPLWLLLGFIIVIALLDLLITGAIPKWAIFAPVFVPLFVRLGVAPEAVLAAYRIGDSPMNAVTPLNAYFALVVTFCHKYNKDAGVGTVVALMLPYVIWLFVLWTALFTVWHLLGLPWGL